MTTLQDYITQVRLLLHDTNSNFWTDNQLTLYVNQAREQLVRDTGCNRVLQTSATITNQETYTYASLPMGDNTLDIININIYWGNTRIPLNYMAWSNFNAQLRYWQSYYNRPIAYSVYGTGTIYLGPVPDQVYTMELDTVVLPNPLVNLGDVETLSNSWISPVQYYAAHKAKYQEQSYGESEIFKSEYIKRIQNVLSTSFTRRLPSPYSQGS